MLVLGKSDPRSVGGYQLLERLGAGGMGTVYLGRAESGRLVAVKVVHQQFAENPEFRVRFRQEVMAVRRVSGAFTAPVLDADPDADRPWMATAYIPGSTLRTRIREDGPLAGAELRALVVGLVEALADLHAVKVIHRDLKPDNVLVTQDGPRVIDFGISRAADHQTITVTGCLLGTPPYMSPEQLSAPHRVTAASDIFSLGAVLVYAATGCGPFDTDNHYVTAYRVVHEPPDVAKLSGTVREIAQWCLAKEPGDRPEPSELLTAFRAAPSSDWGPRPGVSPVPNSAVPTGKRPVPSSRLRRLKVGTAIAASTAIVASGIYAVMEYSVAGVSDEGSKPKVEKAAKLAPAGWAQWETEVHSDRCLPSKGPLVCESNNVAPGRIAAYDTETGKRLWKKGYSRRGDPEILGISRKEYLGFLRISIEPRYFSKQDIRELSRIIAIDVTTGKMQWSTAEGAVEPGSSFYLPGAVVGVGVDDNVIRAWDPMSGDLKWDKAMEGEEWRLRAESRHLYVETSDGGDTTRVELDANTGKELWSHSTEGGHMVFGGHDSALLINADDQTGEEPLVLFDLDTRQEKRTKLPAWARYTEVDDMLYGVTPDGTVIAADAGTGRIKWKRHTGVEADESSPQVASGRLYFAATDARVMCLSAKDGSLLWSSAARRDPLMPLDPAATNLISISAGGIYALSRRETIFALESPL